MKKTALLLFLMAVGFISCKKQYTCRCTVSVYDYNKPVPHVFKTESTPIAEKMSQKQAEDVCQHQQAALNATYRNMFYALTFTTTVGTKAETECNLK